MVLRGAQWAPFGCSWYTCNLKWSKIIVHSEIPVHYTSFRKNTKVIWNARFLIVALWAVLGSIFPLPKPVIRWQMMRRCSFVRSIEIPLRVEGCAHPKGMASAAPSRDLEWFGACQTGRAPFCWRKVPRDKFVLPGNSRQIHVFTCPIHVFSGPIHVVPNPTHIFHLSLSTTLQLSLIHIWRCRRS